jgi:hypothetical protein
MSQFSIPEIITYEDDDFVITSISDGVATATSNTHSLGTTTLPAGDNVVGSKKVVYNSYTTLEFADIYHSRRLDNDVWRSSTTTEDTRITALYWATDILNRQSWIGQPYAYAQALSWPRKWVPNKNYALKGGVEDLALIDLSTTLTESPNYISDVHIPPLLMDATAELALYLLKRSATSTDEVAQYTDQLASLSLGSVSLNFRGDSEVSTTDIPQQVYHLIRDYLNSVKELDPNLKTISKASLRRA